MRFGNSSRKGRELKQYSLTDQAIKKGEERYSPVDKAVAAELVIVATKFEDNKKTALVKGGPHHSVVMRSLP